MAEQISYEGKLDLEADLGRIAREVTKMYRPDIVFPHAREQVPEDESYVTKRCAFGYLICACGCLTHSLCSGHSQTRRAM